MSEQSPKYKHLITVPNPEKYSTHSLSLRALSAFPIFSALTTFPAFPALSAFSAFPAFPVFPVFPALPAFTFFPALPFYCSTGSTAFAFKVLKVFLYTLVHRGLQHVSLFWNLCMFAHHLVGTLQICK